MSESMMDKAVKVQSGVAVESSMIKAIKVKTEVFDAAIIIDNELGPIIASGPIGFTIDIPLGKNQTGNEQQGFGVHHKVDGSINGGAVVPFDQIRIQVKFPREGCTYTFEEASKAVFDRFPDAKGREKGVTVIRVSLTDDAQVEGWVNENKPIINNLTLLDVCTLKTFYVVVRMPVDVASKRFSVDRLPPPFVYPYGTDQQWDVGKFKDLIKANKGHQFEVAYNHPDDNHHMTAVNQSNVQDVLWLDDAAIEIAATKFPAYFVRPDSGAPVVDTDRFFVVVAMRGGFREEHKTAWGCLSKSESFLLHLYDNPENVDPDAKWECNIVYDAAAHPALEAHKIKKRELVLLVRRPKKAEMNPDYVVRDFASRTEADCAFEQDTEQWHHVGLCFDAGLLDCQRRVEAVALFHPLAEPSNAVQLGLPSPDLPADKRIPLTDEQKATLAKVKDNMELHRALVRGNGFYDWMVQKNAPESVVDAMSSLSMAGTSITYRPLPSVNFLGFRDSARAEAIVNEALPHDRNRFRAYLSNRPLGFGIITGGPSTGKTTTGAAATAAMVEMYRRVLCSAPTHAAVDIFAARLDNRTRAMVKACNQGKAQNDSKRCRHRIVIRGYSPNIEVGAFNSLLKDPTLGDKAAPKEWGHTSQWKLHLSLTFWLLAILGSPAVRELHLDDDEGLWKLRRQINGVLPLRRLRDVATGVTTWEQYEQEGLVEDKLIQHYLVCLLPHANMLCITPAATENVPPYKDWKTRLARGVAVDEAASMNRADLYCVWGNTLLPCFLFGNPKQLPLTVLEPRDKDSDNNPINRFAKSGRVSALLFFQATGIPVYRLKTHKTSS